MKLAAVWIFAAFASGIGIAMRWPALPRGHRYEIEHDPPLKADFLKVPHHGSKTSSTDAFVAAVAPKVAVVSVGDGNQFGHPVDSVVARYAAAGVRFLRTDRDGEVTALTDGQTLTVRTFAEDHPQ